MRKASITRRLVIWVTTATILFWVVGAGLGAYVMRDEFGEIFDSAMQETADRLLPLAVDDIRKGEIPDVPKMIGRADGYLVYQIRDKTGSVAMRSHEASSAPFDAPLVEGFWQGATMRVFTRPSEDKALFVQVADSMAHRTEAMQDGVLALLLPLLVLIPLSVVTLLQIVGRAMAPLRDLKTAIAEKDSGNLTPLATEGLPSELEPIAVSLNLVLVRLADALRAEREFAANSAHELRTPLAGAMAQVQLLVAELGASKHADRARLIVQSLKKLTQLTEKLLQLARADAGIGRSDTSNDLFPIVRMVVEDARRHYGPGHRIELGDMAGSFIRPIDPDAFAIVLRNLVENAVIHGEASGPVLVSADANGLFCVRNPSRPYSEHELEDIRQRFHHPDATKPGSGLGLSIVERLLSQIRATLELRSITKDGKSVFEAIIQVS